MPIEFACESCTKLLRVPDGTGGRNCECPACGALLLIPDPDEVDLVDEREPAAESDKLRISCPKCQTELVCDANLAGTKGQCRNCKYIFLISQNPHQTGSAEEASGLVFNCPQCNQLFEGREEMQGRKGKCHACGAVFPIELKRPRETLPTSPLGAAGLPQPASQSPRSSTLRLACVHCQGIMAVAASAAGQMTACPHCHQRLKIPGSAPQPPAAPRASPRTVSPRAASPTPSRAKPARPPSGSSPAARPKSPAAPTAYAAPIAPAAPISTPSQPAFDSRAAAAGDDIWADLGDLSGSPVGNPYQSPAGGGEGAWSAPTSPRRLRGLTFSNAFSLLFATAFPSCLIAAVWYLMGTVAAFIIGALGNLAANGVVTAMQPTTVATALAVALPILLVFGFVQILVGVASMCLTCNLALRAVRGKRLDAEHIFSTGGCYGGVLGLQLIWGLLVGALAGLPWLLNYLQIQPPPVLVALVSLVFVFLLLAGILASCFVPFALIDGETFGEALTTSFSIVFNNLLTVLAVLICGAFLYLAVSLVTCGIAAVALVGLPWYLLAAIYHLADK